MLVHFLTKVTITSLWLTNIIELLKKSVTVILLPKVNQRYTVIDQTILWYGGINFLGFDKAASGTMRLCSAELAKELMDKVNCKQSVQIALPDM